MTTKYTLVFGEQWMIIYILHMDFHSDQKYEKHGLSHSFAAFERLPNVQCYLLIECIANQNVKMLWNESCTI